VGIVVGALAILAVVCGAGGVAGYSFGRISSAFALRANLTPFGFMMIRPDDGFGWQGVMPHDRLGPLAAGAAYLGVTYGEVDPSRASKEGLSPGEGAAVSAVVQGSPAEQAGLQAGDIILAVDGQRLTRATMLRRLIRAHFPGDEVSLLVLHNGEQATLAVVLGQAPNQPPQ
jgi:S1-C subfamily serine protease